MKIADTARRAAHHSPRSREDYDAGVSEVPIDVGTSGVSSTSLQALMQAGGNMGMLQLSGGDPDSTAPLEVAARGVAVASGSLPHLDAVQRSFGRHDVGHVQAQVGGPAVEACDALGATAYATGTTTAFRGAPSLHTAAHEAAHVVQQRAGLALAGGVGSVGDVHEQHADQVADLVVQGKSAEGLLDRYSGAPSQLQRAVQLEGECNAGSEFDALAARLRSAQAAIPGLTEGVRTTTTTSLSSFANTLSAMNARLSGWLDEERGAMQRSVAEMMAQRASGAMSYAGDVVGTAALLNVANPEPVSKVIIGVAMIGAGFVLRAAAREAAEAQSRIVAHYGNRGGTISEMQSASADVFINAFLANSFPVMEFAWSGGRLEQLGSDVGRELERVEEMCGASAPRTTETELRRTQAEQILREYDELAAVTRATTASLVAAQATLRADCNTMFDNAVESYIMVMSSAGPFRIQGTLVHDGHSGGDSTVVRHQRVLGVGASPGDSLSALTRRWIMNHVGRYLREGRSIEFVAEASVHTYESAPGTGGYDLPAGTSESRGAAITLTDTVTYHVDQGGASAVSNAVRDVPPSRVHDYFMALT